METLTIQEPFASHFQARLSSFFKDYFDEDNVNKTYVCHECSLIYSSAQECLVHLNKKHQIYVCPICPKTFKKQHLANAHMHDQSSDALHALLYVTCYEKECECGRRFINNDSLKKHRARRACWLVTTKKQNS